LASAPVLRLPLVARVPLQPPEAVQEVAWAEDHVSVAEPPAATEVADACRVAVGNVATFAEPPPHADKTDTAASTLIKAMERIRKSESKGWHPIVCHPGVQASKNSPNSRVTPAASQAGNDYVAWLRRSGPSRAHLSAP
jgi:hypothetical protein